MITIALTYFRSLGLANLAAALYSVRRQDLSDVAKLVIVDNNTDDLSEAINATVNALDFPVPVRLLSSKHGDSMLTHAWSTNTAMALVDTTWVLMTRADYLLAFDALARMQAIAEAQEPDWDGFVTGNGCHLPQPIEYCERTAWRTDGPQVLQGSVFDYTAIDTGVWFARRAAWERVGGLDGRLSAWGHSQTDFQHRLFLSGTYFHRIPDTLFWHPWHDAPRDLALADQQLRDTGGNLKTMWTRYHGPVMPYL